MSITKKILLSFASMIVITVMAGISIFMRLKSMDNRYSAALSVDLPQ